MLPTVTLSARELAWARAVALAECENIRRHDLQTGQHRDPRGDFYQKHRGALAEAAFYAMAQRPLPTVEAQASKFKHEADALRHYEIRSVKAPWHQLLLQAGDRHPAGLYWVLIMVDQTFAKGLGWLPVDVAWSVKWWNAALPTPTWAVSPDQMRSWGTLPEPDDEDPCD